MRQYKNNRTEESGLVEGYDALKEGGALVDHVHRVLLGLSGKDPIGLFSAILSNELPSEEGRGVYGLLLDAKGHIQTDLRILKRADGSLVAEAEPEGATAARQILGRYAPFSRVEVEELSEATEDPWTILGLYGPRSQEALESVAGELPELAEHQTAEIVLPGSQTPLLVAGVSRPVAGYDLIGPEEALDKAREGLLNAGAVNAAPQAYEAVRIEAGVPRFGADLTPDNFPGEAGILERAVSFAKGCYPGQETVSRMHYRGHPNRSLYHLSVEGEPPDAGCPITQSDKEVGRLTSISPLEDGVALGYIHRKADLTAPLQAEGTEVWALEVARNAREKG